jgi:rhodanese-related sulfurtransferase/DNA-binding transcriptional ArsR family regulator
MEKRALKNVLYRHVGQVVKAMANSHRLEIIDLLANGPKPVERIARETGLSIANASQHLQVMRQARLLDSERRGNFIYYSLAEKEVYEVYHALRELGMKQQGDMSRLLSSYRNSMNTAESMSLDQVKEKEEVFIIDVRSLEEYEAGHISGAFCVPLAELPERLNELPAGRLIVAYCRGPFCTYADEAVRQLKERGFRAVRLEANPLEFTYEAI